MKILIIILIITVLLIVLSYIFAFSSHQKQNKFFDAIQTKKGCFKIIVIILSPVILYSAITLVLMLVRGDCFVGYYVGGRDIVYYQDNLYYKITDEDKKDEAYEYGKGLWTCENTFVSGEAVKFPYIEYWIPDFIFGHLFCPGAKDAKYIGISEMDERGNIYYERVEE